LVTASALTAIDHVVRGVWWLEDRFQTQLSGKRKSGLRIIVTRAGSGAANLATSTCTRYVRDGVLTEVVDLDGDGARIGSDELERFIASFPIDVPERAGAR
jgi:hypothetical protein